MRGHGRTTWRGGAVLGALGLLAATVGGLPAQDAKAASADVGKNVGASAAALVPLADSDMLTLPADAVYSLSPQLAGLLGRSTVDAAGLRSLQAAARPALPGDRTPPVGTTLFWPALDQSKEALSQIYLKQYTLRAVGKKIEVWVATGQDGVSTATAFPAGDCRNDVANSTVITDEQARYLVREFDENMYPKETAAFSTPPNRAGVNTVPGLTAAGLNFAGDGDHTVTLIDNVRDPNFYDFPTNKSYIAGFYAPIFNQITDRNVMTIDAFDWLHRTGASPSNDPNENLCKSRPARPFAYEGVFAHEWQHLLQQYQDAEEVPWINEGLSDFAISLTHYGDTAKAITEQGAQSHIYCFQGFGIVKGPANPNPNPCGGPQNSLTSWGDEGSGSEILADYGNAWSFMLFLFDRYGTEFMSALHRDGTAQGLKSLQAQLDRFAKGAKVADVLHDYQLMNLVDHVVDTKGGTVSGISKNRVTTKSLDATLNLANPTAYDKAGAAANGADYILLKQNGKSLRSVGFLGGKTVPAGGGDAGTVSVPTVGDSDHAGATVADWYVSLVGIDKAGKRVLVASRTGLSSSWTAKQLAAFKSYPMVVAVIAHDDPDDLDGVGDYAGYSLKANGVDQPGG